MNRVKAMPIVAVILLCFGCASIVSKSSWPVTINSNPSGATVNVKNKHGIAIHTATTPATIVLESGDGYFSSANYSFYFEKDGYSTSMASLSGNMNGWYIGNLLFGGVIGFLVVDPLTGAMYKLDNAVYGNLIQNPTAPKVDVQTNITTNTVAPKNGDVVEQLKKLKELKDAGILNDDEYEKRRNALVDKL